MNKTILVLIIFITFSLGFGTFISKALEVKAQSTPKIIINELMPNPLGSDNSFEWVELYNNSLEDIDLTDWKIDGNNLSGVIKAENYLIIAKNKSDLLTRFPELKEVIQVNISLNNSNDIVTLIDNNEITIDLVSYTSSSEDISLERKGPLNSENCNLLIANNSSNSIEEENLNKDILCWPSEVDPIDPVIVPASISKILFSEDNTNFFENVESIDEINLYLAYELIGNATVINEKWSINNEAISSPFLFKESIVYEIKLELTLEDGTVIEKISNGVTILPKPLEIPLTLQISEVSANPLEGEDEWIEIYNFGSSKINIYNFFVQDKADRVNSVFPLVELEPYSYHVVSASDLNNSSEEIRLFSPEGEILDYVGFGSSAIGLTFGRKIGEDLKLIPEFDGETFVYLEQTALETPNSQNAFGVGNSNEYEIFNILDAKNQPLDSVLGLEGFVSSELNNLGENLMYLQDSTSGIKIKLSFEYESIQLGQKVKAIGTLKESRNEKYLLIDNPKNLEMQNSLNLISPSVINTDNFESLEGILVSAEGEIINNYSTSFDIETEYGLLRISLLTNTRISVEKSKGDYVEVTGVFSQYDELYRILPRNINDIKVIPKTTDEEVESINPKVKTSSSKLIKASTPKATETSVTGVSGISTLSSPLPSLEINKTTPVTTSPLPIKSYLLYFIPIIITTIFLLYLLNIHRKLKSFIDNLNNTRKKGDLYFYSVNQ